MSFPLLGYGNDAEVDELEERISNLEEQLKSYPFSFDIKLRTDVVTSLKQQEWLLADIKSIKEKLEELESKGLPNGKGTSGDSHKESEVALKELRDELLSLFESYKSNQNLLISSLNDTAEGRFSTISEIVQTSSDQLYYFLVFLTVVTSGFGLIVSFFGFKFNREVRKTLEQIAFLKQQTTKALYQAKTAKKLYEENESTLQENVKDLQRMHYELSILHAVVDFRENYRFVVINGMFNSAKANSLLTEGEALLSKLHDENTSYLDNDTKANISHICSILGVLYYHHGEYDVALEKFKSAKDNNVKNFLDRYRNEAAVAAKLYVMFGEKDDGYFDIVQANFIDVCRRKNSSDISQFERDEDIKPLLGKLRKNNETFLAALGYPFKRNTDGTLVDRYKPGMMRAKIQKLKANKSVQHQI